MQRDLTDPTIKLFIGKLDSDNSQKRLLEVLKKVKCLHSGSIRIWIQLGNRYICTETAGKEAAHTKGVSISADIDSVVRDTITSGKTIVTGPGKNPRFLEVGKIPGTNHSIVHCIPMKRKDGTSYGAVQVLTYSESGSRSAVDPDCLELLEGLINLGGIAISASMDFADIQLDDTYMSAAGGDSQAPPVMIGKSDVFLKARIDAEIYATCDYPVMVTGESGTGKELIAREIHRLSSRKVRPFLIQNCSAIPDGLLESELFGYRKGAFTGANEDKIGLFEAANGGTLFLDEIGEMPIGLQAKILRVIQSHEIKPLGTTHTHKVNVRIISSTNRDLTKAIEKGDFRKDLYYRLNVLPLQMPPIRERKEDIPLLLTHFLEHFAQLSGKPPKTLDPETMRFLSNHSWPGNIREMENLVKYFMTVIHGDTIHLSYLPLPHRKIQEASPDQLPAALDPENTTEFSMREMERDYVLSLLERTKWNVTSAADMAGVKRTTFSYRMKKLGIRRN
jgi:transcriptional regulator with GAF, ATPase, and Fis domain